MNLHRLLERREADGNPLRVSLIGAGKFGSMFAAQARATRGRHVVAVADLAPDRARRALFATGWTEDGLDASDCADAVRRRTTYVNDDAAAVIDAPEIDIVVDATGSPAAGIDHVLACCRSGKHIVMVNVEADALAGPLLARRAAEAGIVAKRDLREGEVLDGEGGYTVYGKLMPAADSLALGGLPLGLAHRVALRRPVASGEPVRWSDVVHDETSAAVRFRRQMETEFGLPGTVTS